MTTRVSALDYLPVSKTIIKMLRCDSACDSALLPPETTWEPSRWWLPAILARAVQNASTSTLSSLASVAASLAVNDAARHVTCCITWTESEVPIAAKKMHEGGAIINISSTAGILGFPLRSPYAASKWAIIGVTKTLAMELGKFNIRVNAVCPGTIKGDRMKRVIRDKAKFTKVSTKTIEKDFVSMSSMKQWILEEDIGKMCSFLISDDSNKVSGQAISVDGHTERND